MNDEQTKLQEMLERATAPGDDMPADLDAETSSLREGWLALCKLLEDARFPSEKPLDNWQVVPRRRGRQWSLAPVIAVAAMLLIAVSLAIIYGLLNGSKPGQPIAPQLTQDDRPTKTPSPSLNPEPRTLNPAPPSLNPEPRTLNPALAWDDSFDEDLTTVAQAVVSVQEDSYAGVRGFSAIEYGLEQIRKGMEDGTL